MNWTPRDIERLKQVYPTSQPETLVKYFKTTPKEIVEEAISLGLERSMEKAIKYCQVAVTSKRWLNQYRGFPVRAIPSISGIAVGYDLIVNGSIVAYNLPIEEIVPPEQAVVIPVNQPNLTPEQRSEIMENAVRPPVGFNGEHLWADKPKEIPTREAITPPIRVDRQGPSTTNGGDVTSKWGNEPLEGGNAKVVTPLTGNTDTSIPVVDTQETPRKHPENYPENYPEGNADIKQVPDAGNGIPKGVQYADKKVSIPIVEDPTMLKEPPKGPQAEQVIETLSPAVKAVLKAKEEGKTAKGKAPAKKQIPAESTPTPTEAPKAQGDDKGKPEPVVNNPEPKSVAPEKEQSEKPTVNSQADTKVVGGKVEAGGKKPQRGEWTPMEIDYITRAYPLNPVKEIAKKLKRSEKAVKRKSEMLGLKKAENPMINLAQNPEVADTVAELQKTLEKHLKGEAREELMAVLGSSLDKPKVAEFMYKTGLKRWVALITYEAEHGRFITESMVTFNAIMNSLNKTLALEAGLPEGSVVNMVQFKTMQADAMRGVMKWMTKEEREQHIKNLKSADSRRRVSLREGVIDIPSQGAIDDGE